MGTRAFNGCEIDELVFKAKRCVKIDGYNSDSSTDNVGAFGGARIHSVVFSDEIENINTDLFRGSRLYIPDMKLTCTNCTQTKAFITRDMQYRGEPASLSNNVKLVTACGDKFVDIPLFDDYEAYDKKHYDYFYKELSDNIQLEGLKFDTNYKVENGVLLNNWFLPVTLEKDAFSFQTKGLEVNVDCIATQTTLTYKASYKAGDANIDDAFWFDPKGTPQPEDRDKWDYGRRYPGTEYKRVGLSPGGYYSSNMLFIIISNGKMLEKDAPNSYTQSLSPQISAYNVTPTTINVQGEYVQGDAVITGTSIKERVTGAEEQKSTMKLKDLEPETDYIFTFRVEGQNFYDEKQIRVTTPAPTFETQPAKAMTTTVVLLAAKTNLADEVENVGFEWRRYDAPGTMPSSRVEAIVIDGVLTGALGGVNPEVYYNYRPYMSCSNGEEYFGEWITFLTGDANVYFDPTVRTYAAEIIDDFSAKLSGSVVRGSAEIERQGFQYWPNTSTRGIDEMQEVEVSGQRMSFVVTGLNAGTSYSYRTFVQTAKGTTYGQMEEFTTSNVTGIGDIIAEESKVQIRGSLSTQIEMAAKDGRGSCYWQLYTVNGTLVGHGKVLADGEYHRLNMPCVTGGLYILSVTYGNNRQSFKLTKRG